ncbi:hypothetical protein AVEN_115108-1 [Araneus ventricosus]|uniref:Uncharacterized protein n=1 Tax=Araneus ventricosus TaxID=182803 RepID=A0A4Y1ZXA7_ARAVE|nr:hypothetical protein AVEN_115108-1 [Araneus ventricosus]
MYKLQEEEQYRKSNSLDMQMRKSYLRTVDSVGGLQFHMNNCCRFSVQDCWEPLNMSIPMEGKSDRIFLLFCCVTADFVFCYLQVAKCLIPSKWEGVYLGFYFTCLINAALGDWGNTCGLLGIVFDSSPSILVDCKPNGMRRNWMMSIRIGIAQSGLKFSSHRNQDPVYDN